MDNWNSYDLDNQYQCDFITVLATGGRRDVDIRVQVKTVFETE